MSNWRAVTRAAIMQFLMLSLYIGAGFASARLFAHGSQCAPHCGHPHDHIAGAAQVLTDAFTKVAAEPPGSLTQSQLLLSVMLALRSNQAKAAEVPELHAKPKKSSMKHLARLRSLFSGFVQLPGNISVMVQAGWHEFGWVYAPVVMATYPPWFIVSETVEHIALGGPLGMACTALQLGYFAVINSFVAPPATLCEYMRADLENAKWYQVLSHSGQALARAFREYLQARVARRSYHQVVADKAWVWLGPPPKKRQKLRWKQYGIDTSVQVSNARLDVLSDSNLYPAALELSEAWLSYLSLPSVYRRFVPIDAPKTTLAVEEAWQMLASFQSLLKAINKDLLDRRAHGVISYHEFRQAMLDKALLSSELRSIAVRVAKNADAQNSLHAWLVQATAWARDLYSSGVAQSPPTSLVYNRGGAVMSGGSPPSLCRKFTTFRDSQNKK